MDEKLFKDVDNITIDAYCSSIACDLTTLFTNIMLPKNLGVAVYLHHMFRSRKLIDLINSLGFCVSYTELGTFLTSSALHLDSKRNYSEVNEHIFPETVPVNNRDHIIMSATDSWHHNEHTINDKKTTHA